MNTLFNDKGIEFVGPAIGRPVKHKKKEPQKSMWEKQGLKMSDDGLIGLMMEKPTMRFPVKRSDVGGWLDEEEYRKMYSLGTRKNGYAKNVGAYMGPKEAVEFMKKCRTLQMLDPAWYERESCPGVVFRCSDDHPDKPKPEDQLYFSDDVRIVWCRGSGCFAPVAGCLNLGKAWINKGFTNEYIPFVEDMDVCPLVCVLEELSDEDCAVVDKFMVDNIDSLAVSPWDWSEGFPTVVNVMRVVHRDTASKCGKFMEETLRLVTDFRYANAVSHNEPILLPTHVSFVRALEKVCLVAKQDAKSGFHQVAVSAKKKHMLAVHWRGRIFAFNCMAFGIRNAPADFTRRTQAASQEVVLELREEHENSQIMNHEVYVDDFFQGWRSFAKEEYASFLEGLVRRGIVLGKKKCISPTAELEILGLMVDTQSRMLKVSDRKLQAIKIEIENVILDSSSSGKRHMTTLRLAQLLGRLNALEPALPNSLLIVRPLFEDLKVALTTIEVNESAEELMRGRDSTKYAWNVVQMSLSALSISSLEYLRDNIDEMNGQSFDLKNATLIIRWDASSYAKGATCYKSFGNRAPELLFTISGEYFEQHMIDFSSLAREALALLMVIKMLAEKFPDHLWNAVIKGVTDNQGLACRYWKGSTKIEANLPLIETCTILRAHAATLQSIWWMPREFLDAEDHLSKPEGMEPFVVVDQQWFDSWNDSLPKILRANVDAFATRENAKLPLFASTTIGSGTFHDGAQYSWHEDHVLWMFPPNVKTIIKKAVLNWMSSKSSAMYLCVSESLESYLEKLMVVAKGKLLVNENGTPVRPLVHYRHDKKWLQRIYFFEKKF